MNFNLFRNTFEKLFVFNTNDIKAFFSDFDTRRLFEWQDKGYIIKIRNKWYCFPAYRDLPNSNMLTANIIYKHSYVSVQYALSYYGLIPEGVFTITSVTSNKRNYFETELGAYNYQHIKPELFFGYTYIPFNPFKKPDNEARQIKIATLEKAILDFFYLNAGYKTAKDMLDLRFNETILYEDMNKEKLFQYLEKFENKALDKRINVLIKTYLND